MRVGCWDCGKPHPKHERPRSWKSGMKNTVSVCLECKNKWFKNHAYSKESDEHNPLMCQDCKIKHCKEYCEPYKKKYLRKRIDGGGNSKVM